MNRTDYIFLFQRDLRKLSVEISAYLDEELIWIKIPGTINSGGHLCQHLIGNLRTYIGQTLGNFPYIRDREAEFSSRLFSKIQLLEEIDLLRKIISETLEQLAEGQISEEYPCDIVSISETQTVGLVLTHLAMHLAYHTGQINYHRRIINEQNVTDRGISSVST